MKGRMTVVVIAVVAMLVAGSLAPRRAHAMNDILKVGLITAAVGAGIMLIAIIGAALTRDDPRWLTEASPGDTLDPLRADERIRFGTRCPQSGGVTTAVCW